MLPTVLMADRVMAAREVLRLSATEGGGIERMRPDSLADLKARVQRAHVFECSNIAEYCEHLQATGKEFKNSDLSAVRPPFDELWCEYREKVESGTWRLGILCTVLPATGEEVRARMPEGTLFYGDVPDEMLLLELALAIFTYSHDAIIALGSGSVYIDERGTARTSLGIAVPRPASRNRQPLNDHEWRHTRAVADRAFPFFFSLQFLNCRNVVQVEHEPPSKLSRARQRKSNAPPLLKYRTLQIEPMRRVLQTEGGIAENGLQRALHICRGHFATYTPEKGFLGRPLEAPIKVWRPHHTRGTAEAGMVAKSYSLKAPQESR